MLLKQRLSLAIDIQSFWYQPKLTWLCCLLLPFSYLFGALVAVRRFLYRSGFFKSYAFKVPIIVVGNVAVGGTGKTPFVIGLAEKLKAEGYQPGIITRGFGGYKHANAHRVLSSDTAAEVGDEALLLLKTQCPVVVCVNKVAGVQYLIQQNCNLIISDDGLQHYRLRRDVEIAMVDGERQLGNQLLLPAGPLRESVKRLREVDAVVQQTSVTQAMSMHLVPTAWRSVKNPMIEKPLDGFADQAAHVIAGIGNPQRFFEQVKRLGVKGESHVFMDHHAYQSNDLEYMDELPILMTEKDAVKCRAFADDRYWYLEVVPSIHESVINRILTKLANRKQS